MMPPASPLRRTARHRLASRLAAMVTVAALGAALASCAATPDIDASASTGLQSAVVDVAALAAAGDTAGARTRLDALEGELDTAVAAGDVGADRAARIRADIALVRADLAAIPEPEVTPTATPEPTPTVDNTPGNPGNGNGNKPEKPGKPGKSDK